VVDIVILKIKYGKRNHTDQCKIPAWKIKFQGPIKFENFNINVLGLNEKVPCIRKMPGSLVDKV
jgi:hypothetical protein